MSNLDIKNQNNDISQIEANTSENNQKNEQDKSDLTINNESKTKSSAKTIVIVGIVIALISALIVIILVITLKKKSKKRNRINFDDNQIDEDEDENENTIDYDEAENLIGSETTKENHDLLNEISGNINESLSICNNVNFTKINVTVNDSLKNIDFLTNTNESSLQVAKDDLDLYNSRYVTLSQQANSFSKEASESLNNISVPLNEFKNEVDNITKQFEKNIQNLAIPLALNSNKTSQNVRNLISDELKTKY